MLLQMAFLIRKAVLGHVVGIWSTGRPCSVQTIFKKLPGGPGFSGVAALLEQNVFSTAAEMGTMKSHSFCLASINEKEGRSETLLHHFNTIWVLLFFFIHSLYSSHIHL